MTETPTSRTEVLIVGAGPAGLMAAAAFTRLGIQFRIVDRRLDGETYGQADGIQPRMQEIWDSLDLGDELRRNGAQVHRMAMYGPDPSGQGIAKTSETYNVMVPNARYPFEVIEAIETIEKLIRGSSVVEYATIPVSLEMSKDRVSDPQAYPIKCVVRHLDIAWLESEGVHQLKRSGTDSAVQQHSTEEVIECKYLIGCDGARSWVRRAVDIPMDGDRMAVEWGVVDFTPEGDFPTPRSKNIIQTPANGPLGWIPRPNGTARIYSVAGTQELAADTVTATEGTSSEARERVLKGLTGAFRPFNMEMKDVTWASIFTVAQRVAERYHHERRVFVAGDACHTHSPKAGQGANASMTDTYNLAWKIAYVLHGAHPTLLDTYEQERRTFAQELIVLDKEIDNLFRPDMSLTPEEYGMLLGRQAMFASGIGITYDSILTQKQNQSLAPALVLGARFPPADCVRYADWASVNVLDVLKYSPRFSLLLFPGASASAPFAHAFAAAAPILKDVIRTSAFFAAKKEADLGLAQTADAAGIYKEAYVDDKARPESAVGGTLYESYGISPKSPIMALVRPDGHLALLAQMTESGLAEVKSYFAILKNGN